MDMASRDRDAICIAHDYHGWAIDDPDVEFRERDELLRNGRCFRRHLDRYKGQERQPDGD